MKRTVLALRGRKARARVADEVWNFSPPADWDSESFDTPFPESRCALSLLRPRLCRVMASENLGSTFSPPLVSGPESGPDDAATGVSVEPRNYLEAAMR